VIGFGAVAQAHAALGNTAQATATLRELAEAGHCRESQYYVVYLPALARVAIALDDRHLCRELADGLEPRGAYAEQSLASVAAALSEAEGDADTAATAHAASAIGWEQLEVVTERAHALYGRGRCLMALGRAAEAGRPLQDARAIFVQLGAAPSIADIDELLDEEAALSS
jgi:hypothetical protein